MTSARQDSRVRKNALSEGVAGCIEEVPIVVTSNTSSLTSLSLLISLCRVTLFTGRSKDENNLVAVSA